VETCILFVSTCSGFEDPLRGIAYRIGRAQLDDPSTSSGTLLAIRINPFFGEPTPEWHYGLRGRHYGDNARGQEPSFSTALLRLKKRASKSGVRPILWGSIQIIFQQTRAFLRSDTVPEVENQVLVAGVCYGILCGFQSDVPDLWMMFRGIRGRLLK
jgi:hypothetical protein